MIKRNRTIRKKKRNALEIFEKRSEPKFPRRSHYCRFCGRKKWTIQMQMKTSAFYLYSHLSDSFNDEQKFLARMEILKIMRHVKLQQNLDRYSSCSLPYFSKANSFVPNSSHFPTNPQHLQPVTSMQNSEIVPVLVQLLSRA